LIQVLPVQQSISYRFLIRQKSVVAVSALDMWGRGAALPRVPQQRRTAARAAAFGLCWWLLSARAAVRPRLRCLQRRGTGTRLRERLPGCKLRLVAARWTLRFSLLLFNPFFSHGLKMPVIKYF